MSNRPDNYDSARFTAAYGDPAYDRRLAIAESNAAPIVANAKRLKEAAQAFLLAVTGIDFDGDEPATRYDLADIVSAVENAAAIDLDKFERELVSREMES